MSILPKATYRFNAIKWVYYPKQPIDSMHKMSVLPKATYRFNAIKRVYYPKQPIDSMQ